MRKLTSRKFWVSAGACLASIAISIEGLHTNNETVTITGIVCAVMSAAIYAAVEAATDVGCSGTIDPEAIIDDNSAEEEE